MEDERRSREGKLRDRLAKKRRAKEEEMQKAALSDRVSSVQPCTYNRKSLFELDGFDKDSSMTMQSGRFVS